MDESSHREYTMAKRGAQLLNDGAELIVDICSLRIPKPKSTAAFIERCQEYSKRYLERYKKAS